MTRPADPTPSRRRWSRPSVRGIMILVALAAVAVVWPVTWIRSQREAIRAVRAAGGSLGFDYQAEIIKIPGTNFEATRGEPAAPRWLRRWLGDELFQSVRAVSFSYLSSPEVLAFLPRFDQLESLTLEMMAGPEEGYEPLRELRRLRTLNLRGPGITDRTLGEVAGVAGLDRLWIMDAGATDAGLARLTALPDLADLTLSMNQHLSDAGVARLLAGLPRLRSFELRPWQQPVHAAVAALARHPPDLRDLRLEWNGVTAADCAAVGELTGLRQLFLAGTGVDDAGMAHLGVLAELERLEIAHTKVTDAGLARLGALGRLRTLDAAQARITDAGLATLARLPRLAELDLAGNPGVTDAGLAALGSSRSLQKLDVSGTAATPAGTAALIAARPALKVRNLAAAAPIARLAVPMAPRH